MSRIKPGLLLATLFLLSLPVLAQQRFIPHVTRVGGGFTTEVIVENDAVVESTFTLNPYDSEGNALTPYQGTLPGRGGMAMSSQELFAEGDQVSHFSIDAGSDVRVSVAYNFQAGNGSPAHVPSSNDQASSWRIFPGNWDAIFDGLAIVNLGDEPTDVWIAQKDFENNVIQAERVVTGLAPSAKALYVIGSPTDSVFTPRPDAYFEISADKRMAVTALRGTLASADLGVLWANDATPQSASISKRDDKRVWFIEDGSLYDVMEMMGYNVATDRLWQLELFRRTGNGSLSEVFGQSLLTQDTTVIRLGYSEQELRDYFAGLDNDSKVMMQAYVDGINRRIGQVNADSDILPFEFKALSFPQVDAWDVTDVMAFATLTSRLFSMDTFGFGQVENAALVQDFAARHGAEDGAIIFNDIRWTDDPESSAMIPQNPVKVHQRHEDPLVTGWVDRNVPDLRAKAAEMRQMFDDNKQALKEIGAFFKGGSYAWVVNGSKTESGNPILFAGPQIDFAAPVMAVEGSIESDYLTVSGMAVTGIPGFIIGRTPNHAWSVQTGHAHMWDYYLEDQADISIHHTVSLQVPGLGQVDIPAYRSARGPVIDPDAGISWRYSNWGKEWSIGLGLLGMARAQNMDEFGTALESHGMSQHVLYADVNNNIAYWHTGRVPVRPEGDYRLPQGFNGDPIDYDVNVLEPMPHDRNPTRGWYGGWNNRASMDSIDGAAVNMWGPFHRSHIIEEYLESRNDFTFDDLREFEREVAATWNASFGGIQWPFYRDAFVDAINLEPTQERLDAIAMLDGFDGHYPRGDRTDWLTATLTEDAHEFQRLWLIRMISALVFDDVGSTALSEADARFQFLLHLLNPESAVPVNFDYAPRRDDPDAPQTLETIIQFGLDESLQLLGDLPWEAPRFTNAYDHPILGTMHQTVFWNRSTYTQVVEIGQNGPIRIESIFGLGQSGTLYGTNDGRVVTPFGTDVTNIDINTFVPPADDPFFGMVDLFNNFQLREFPLFNEN